MPRTAACSALALVLMLLLPPQISATTYHVPGDAATIQAGITAASAGDTVLVACNTYYEHDITMKSGVVLRSETGSPDCVTIDAQGLGRVMICSSCNAATRIEGITLAAGQSSNGAGLYLSSSSIQVTDCIFRYNSATSGGGIMCNFSKPVLTGCRFEGNTATSYGGGVYCYNSTAPTLVGCEFMGNSAGSYGAGVYYQSSTATGFTDCSFTDNHAGYAGSAIYLYYNTGPLTLDGCTFFRNILSNNSGALYLAGGTTTLTVNACTLAQNDGAVAGTGAVVLDHTIVAFNRGRAVSGPTAGASCCDVFANSGGDWAFSLAGQDTTNGNISADPLFCDMRAGDLQLATASPCLADSTCGDIGAWGEGCSSATPPRVWLVPSEVTTIQAALDSAWVGDIVEVACGTYYEAGLQPSPGVILRSETGSADCVVIDAQGQDDVVSAVGTTGATLQGLTLTGGAGSGGGIEVRSAASLTLTDCVLVQNEGNNAGGLYCESNCTVNLYGCTVAYNDGSGLMASGGAFLLERCLVACNGGAAVVVASAGDATLACCDLFGNAGGDWTGMIAAQAGQDGNFSADPGFCDPHSGDLYVSTTSPCLVAPGCGQVGALGAGCSTSAPPRLWLVPSEVATIQAALDSAWVGDLVAIDCGTYYEHDIQLRAGVTVRSMTGLADCVTVDAQGLGRGFVCGAPGASVEGITVTHGSAAGSYGGGIYCDYGGSLTVTDCVIFDNDAYFGGGIALNAESPLTVTGCTFAYNTASQKGAAIWSADTMFVENSIIGFSANSVPVEVNTAGAVWLSCTDVYGNVGGDFVGVLTGQDGGAGNFSADPQFCDAPRGDFGLASTSPCLAASGCGQMGALGSGCSSPEPPRVWHVPSECPTIQAGIDSAAWGDTVVVACGSYTWSGEGTGDEDGLIRLKSWTTLRSETGLPDCVTIDAEGSGRVIYGENLNALTRIEGFTLTGGDAIAPNNVGGGIYLLDAELAVSHCDLAGNVAEYGGAVCAERSQATFDDCTFTGNTGEIGGGAVRVLGVYNSIQPGPDFTLCTFIGNGVTPGTDQGSCVSVWYATTEFDHCLFYGNGFHNEAVFRATTGTPRLFNSIVAFNAGGTLYASGNGGMSLTCSDIFGNGGESASYLSGVVGVNGNISSDPIFCDAEGGDFHLSWESPCLDTPCGSMGTTGLGSCGFIITSVRDITPDQGGQARVRWERAFHDSAGTDRNVTSYGLWRRIDDASGKARVGGTDTQRLLPNYEPPAGEWDCVATVPAWGQPGYSVVSPTLCDSTIADGMCWSVFFVTAHTDDPAVFYVSAPDSGYSVDNLAPGVPAGFSVEYGASGNALSWDPVTDADFRYYRVYRGADPDFVPDESTFLQALTETSWFDPVAGGAGYHYKVTATDFAGNEGEAAEPMQVTGVGDGWLPERFAMLAAHPNPFRGSTEVRFDLPEPVPVTLVVYDVAGRRVRTLAQDRIMAAGRQAMTWDGRDDGGRVVARGLYFGRLQAGPHTGTWRLTLLR